MWCHTGGNMREFRPKTHSGATVICLAVVHRVLLRRRRRKDPCCKFPIEHEESVTILSNQF